MTPVQKAYDIWQKMMNADVLVDETSALQCALVAVDELIEVALWAGDIDGEIEEGSKEYYVIVKEELRKL
jgi:hypothetical protein